MGVRLGRLSKDASRLRASEVLPADVAGMGRMRDVRMDASSRSTGRGLARFDSTLLWIEASSTRDSALRT